MYELNGKYMVCTNGDWNIDFFYKIYNGNPWISNIAPITFNSKKKAKRVMRRLNKYHRNNGEEWFVVQKVNNRLLRRAA